MGREEGVVISESQFAATFGQTSREIIRKRWTQEGLHPDEAEIKRLDDRKEALFREIIGGGFPAVAGARELVAGLRAAGFRLGVGSSAPPENVDLVLDRFGGRSLFDAVVNGMDVSRGKPDPQVFLLVAERMEVAPSCCAVIEDAVPGIEAARRAGMAAVAYVSTGRSREEFEKASADLIVQSLTELTPDVMGRISGGPKPQRSGLRGFKP